MTNKFSNYVNPIKSLSLKQDTVAFETQCNYFCTHDSGEEFLKTTADSNYDL